MTEYAFIGADGGGIVFYASAGWVFDPVTGEVSGTLDSISFGQQTVSDPDGGFSHSVEMSISNINVSTQESLDSLFADASTGVFSGLFDLIASDGVNGNGSAGRDSLYGTYAPDILRGGDGDDRLVGIGDLVGGDRLNGGNGNDTIVGSIRSDVIYGDNGDDTINARSGKDIIKAGNGNDHVLGGRGTDKLYGNAGDDFLSGGRDADTIYGGTGNDYLIGGSSPDRFVFEKSAGDDTIGDFKAGKAGKDVIVFHDLGLDSFTDVLDHSENVVGGVLITYDEGTLLLRNVKLQQLDSHDFLFS